MSQQQQSKSVPQSKEALLKSYQKRLKDDIKSILDNFQEIITLGKMEEDIQVNRMTQAEEDHFEMEVRASNMVRAGQSLMKLVSDIKQFLILNDFPYVNKAIMQNNELYRRHQLECDQKLLALRDEMAAELFELEEEYYSSQYK